MAVIDGKSLYRPSVLEGHFVEGRFVGQGRRGGEDG
jgi:hypothetical protein